MSGLGVSFQRRRFSCFTWACGRSPPPPALSADQAKNNEKDHSADGGYDDRSANTGANADAQFGQQPTSDQGTNHADTDVPDQTEPEASHKDAGKPSGDESDQQNDEQTLA